jgi:hypothetical protein
VDDATSKTSIRYRIFMPFIIAKRRTISRRIEHVTVSHEGGTTLFASFSGKRRELFGGWNEAEVEVVVAGLASFSSIRADE